MSACVVRRFPCLFCDHGLVCGSSRVFILTWFPFSIIWSFKNKIPPPVAYGRPQKMTSEPSHTVAVTPPLPSTATLLSSTKDRYRGEGALDPLLEWTPSPSTNPSPTSAASLFYLAFSVMMVVGPVVGYLEQWRRIHQQRTSAGYAPFVSMILIACNTLRIVYFFGEPYAEMLLWQSVVMLCVQLGLLVTVLKLDMAKRILQVASVHHNNAARGGVVDHDVYAATSASPTSLSARCRRCLHVCNPLSFTPSQLLYRFAVTFAVVSLIGWATFAAFPSSAPSAFGYASLGIEAMLVTPQLVLNLQRRSTEGLSWLLVLTWCLGDVVKMIFFIVESQPAPFVVCGSFQLCCDGLLLVQLWWYRDPLHSRGYGVSDITEDEAAKMSGVTPTMAGEGASVIEMQSASTTGAKRLASKEW